MNYSYQWLDWHRPILHEAASYLLQRDSNPTTWDMTNVIVVVPGGRAGRRLLELLVELAAEHQRQLLPPKIVTLGVLPELLYQPKKPFADLLTQQLAWGQALRELQIRLAPVFSRLPESDEPLAWRDLGDLLRREHTELAADKHDFAKVAEEVESLGGAEEKARWQVLYQVQQRYLQILESLGLWDLQTARLFALEHREFRTAQELVLVGTVDMNGTQRAMLDQVADRVTVLIHAPQEWRDRFDKHGCLVPAKWRDAEIQLDDQRIHLVGGPEQQLNAVVDRIRDFQGRFRADEISIGVPVEAFVPDVQRKLDEHRLPARYGPGRAISEMSPYRLLQAIAEYHDGHSYHAFAALVRHPDLVDWLTRQGINQDWITPLDRFYNHCLPTHLNSQLVASAAPVAQLYQTVELLLTDLNQERRALIEWVEVWRGIVWRVYGEREYDLADENQRRIYRACELLLEALDAIRTVPRPLLGEATAREALELALLLGASDRIPASSEQPAIELLGWLELALDDAPAMIVVGLNDGVVPESVNADPFLPNRLRTQLNLDDNARRYARDAYALSVLTATRSELHVIVGRQDLEGSPLAPSRLLFACSRERLAQRMLRWCSEAEEQREAHSEAHRKDQGEDQRQENSSSDESSAAPNRMVLRPHSDFPIPLPSDVADSLPKQKSASTLELNVTDFKRYLECPYRFFLERWGGLAPLNDASEELDGRSFGNLAHDVLERFGSSALRDSDDAEQIAQFLTTELQRVVESLYGAAPRAAIRVQVERLQRRLTRFAERQAEWFASGWRIHYVEQAGQKQRITLPLDDGTFTLVGRIDRIDYHAATNQYAVLDYKTGDDGQSPESTHVRSKAWVDFQLPLYRHLVRSMQIDAPLVLGYIVLPKELDKVGFKLAEWVEEELAEADEEAWNIARSIRDQDFEEINQTIRPAYDDFRRIVQSGVLKHQ